MSITIELSDSQVKGMESLARHVYKQDVLDACIGDDNKEVRDELIAFLRTFYESEYWE